MSPADRPKPPRVRARFGRRGRRRRVGFDGPLSRSSRQSGPGGHQQDPQLQPRHGISPLRQDQHDDLGRLHGRALETDRQGGAASARAPAGLASAWATRSSKNRHDVVSRCIERGINYIDACVGGEVHGLQQGPQGPPRQDAPGLLLVRKGNAATRPMAHLRKLKKSRRQTASKQAGLDYVDLWRITCHEAEQPAHRRRDRRVGQGPGLGQEERPGPLHRHLLARPAAHQAAIENYPQQLEVICTPYTAKTQVVEDESRAVGGDEEARRGLVRHQAVRQQLALQGRPARPTARTPKKTTASPGWPSATSSATRRSPPPSRA